MKTKILLLAMILSSIMLNNSISQVHIGWLSRYDFDNDGGTALVVDNSGNVYVTGHTDEDFATIKYNSAGDSVWVKKYNGPGNDSDIPTAIAIDNSGNVYVTGVSYGTATSDDYATIKYNSSGVQQWVARYNGPDNSADEPHSIAVDGSGNVYVTGESHTNGTSYDYATIKYNSAGDSVWVKRYNGSANLADYARSLVLDGSGNVYVTGSSSMNISNRDYATVKYNSSGTELWVRRYNGSGIDDANAVAVDGTGNVYVTGWSYGSTADYATIKYNSIGDSLWVKRFSGIGGGFDEATAIAVDALGNVYVSGTTYNGFPTNEDFTTLKYDSSGVLQWNKNYNGNLVNGREEIARSMKLDNLGNVYVAGSSEGTNSDYDYAIVKYNPAGVEQWVQRYVGADVGFTDDPYSIAVDAAYNVYVTGISTGQNKSNDFVTIKYSPNPFAIITCFIQGFYNSSSNNMVSDTARMYLRNVSSPYSIVDSSMSNLSLNGKAGFNFYNITNGVNYYVVLKHRNSIETWSSSGKSFSSDSLLYDFSTAANKAYGNNQKQIDASPLRFGIYGGDQNQDESVDVTDIINIFNDANDLLSGYVQSDVTGDDFVDAADLILCYNNSTNVVSIARP